jgi:hypothetical protein
MLRFPKNAINLSLSPIGEGAVDRSFYESGDSDQHTAAAFEQQFFRGYINNISHFINLKLQPAAPITHAAPLLSRRTKKTAKNFSSLPPEIDQHCPESVSVFVI